MQFKQMRSNYWEVYYDVDYTPETRNYIYKNTDGDVIYTGDFFRHVVEELEEIVAFMKEKQQEHAT